jgi:hypothetical protein
MGHELTSPVQQRCPRGAPTTAPSNRRRVPSPPPRPLQTRAGAVRVDSGRAVRVWAANAYTARALQDPNGPAYSR